LSTFGIFAVASLGVLLAGTPPPEPGSPKASPQMRISAPPDEDRSPAAARLVDAFRRAHEARDVQAFEKLVEWRDVTAVMRQHARESFERDLGQPIQAVQVTPADPEEAHEFTLDSVTYRPNLAPIRVLTVWYEIAGGDWSGGVQKTSYLVGRAEDGSYRIAMAAPVG